METLTYGSASGSGCDSPGLLTQDLRMDFSGSRGGPTHLPTRRLTILPVIGSGAVDAVDGMVLGKALGSERRSRQAWIAGKQNALVASDGATGDRSHVVSPCL